MKILYLIILLFFNHADINCIQKKYFGYIAAIYLLSNIINLKQSKEEYDKINQKIENKKLEIQNEQNEQIEKNLENIKSLEEQKNKIIKEINQKNISIKSLDYFLLLPVLYKQIAKKKFEEKKKIKSTQIDNDLKSKQNQENQKIIAHLEFNPQENNEADILIKIDSYFKQWYEYNKKYSQVKELNNNNFIQKHNSNEGQFNKKIEFFKSEIAATSNQTIQNLNQQIQQLEQNENELEVLPKLKDLNQQIQQLEQKKEELENYKNKFNNQEVKNAIQNKINYLKTELTKLNKKIELLKNKNQKKYNLHYKTFQKIIFLKNEMEKFLKAEDTRIFNLINEFNNWSNQMKIKDLPENWQSSSIEQILLAASPEEQNTINQINPQIKKIILKNYSDFFLYEFYKKIKQIFEQKKYFEKLFIRYENNNESIQRKIINLTQEFYENNQIKITEDNLLKNIEFYKNLYLKEIYEGDIKYQITKEITIIFLQNEKQLYHELIQIQNDFVNLNQFLEENKENLLSNASFKNDFEYQKIIFGDKDYEITKLKEKLSIFNKNTNLEPYLSLCFYQFFTEQQFSEEFQNFQKTKNIKVFLIPENKITSFKGIDFSLITYKYTNFFTTYVPLKILKSIYKEMKDQTKSNNINITKKFNLNEKLDFIKNSISKKTDNKARNDINYLQNKTLNKSL
jgi:hypothetical protein